MVRPVQVNVKAVDRGLVGGFWGVALGWEVRDAGVTSWVGPAGGGWPDPVVLGVNVVPVPEGKPAVKNRVHLDLATRSLAHQAELVERLLGCGARPVDVGQGEVPWVVLADPEGNEFCVLEPREVYRDTGPIAAVVLDCVEPRAVARFWGAATGWAVRAAGEGAALRAPGDVGPYLEFLRVPGTAGVADRVHLDLWPGPGGDVVVEAARLRGLGARELDLGQGAVSWRALLDPEDHAFCVLAP
ncbi:VOC family protein (plasmid) [Streptomyces sp. BI20]|uniref:VOC family protein n=1 Tax=Streptomyces sp. BI20 TaxID=3403460 RepID=UPI003C788EDC